MNNRQAIEILRDEKKYADHKISEEFTAEEYKLALEKAITALEKMPYVQEINNELISRLAVLEKRLKDKETKLAKITAIIVGGCTDEKYIVRFK